MSGVTKHIYDSDIRDILSMWNTELKRIRSTLPCQYTKEDIIQSLKTYFPHEWHSVEIKYIYYTQKDKHLKKRFGKARFNMQPAEQLLEKSKQYRIIMSSDFKENHRLKYSDTLRIEAQNSLLANRTPKIQKVNNKIEMSKSRVQQVTPTYIDQLIGLYERKGTSQKDKCYILAELKKYYSPRIIQFFFKLNDTELNKQLRQEAFYHLQNFSYQPRARKQKYMQVHTKNKKRRAYLKNTYPNEVFSIEHTPNELEYRIANSKEQGIKRYDFFISHSYKDGLLVQKLIQHENSDGKDVFCDWINDSDYLKRHLLCEATLKVIEKRLEQSDALLFVKSEFSMASVWCRYELNYFNELGRPIYTISAEDIEKGIFIKNIEQNAWFVDSNYKERVLLANTH
ncbi:MAG: toll/interleukin-1 receptor domain-containing protein [Firmicutes bacterium]|nr:toll/interleukin-1 receptor domain-containing protein [Bacillota bacterium]